MISSWRPRAGVPRRAERDVGAADVVFALAAGRDVPRVDGGRDGQTVKLCRACSMLFGGWLASGAGGGGGGGFVAGVIAPIFAVAARAGQDGHSQLYTVQKNLLSSRSRTSTRRSSRSRTSSRSASTALFSWRLLRRRLRAQLGALAMLTVGVALATARRARAPPSRARPPRARRASRERSARSSRASARCCELRDSVLGGVFLEQGQERGSPAMRPMALPDGASPPPPAPPPPRRRCGRRTCSMRRSACASGSSPS